MRSTDVIARSLLFVPGDRPERFERATQSGAHAVIFDLEDSVTPEAKPHARESVWHFLDRYDGPPALLRVNATGEAFEPAELELARHSNLAGVVVPKADARNVSIVATATAMPIWPLIETAKGLSELSGICSMKVVVRLMLGTVDLSNDMGLDLDHAGGQASLNTARHMLVSNSVIHQISPPVDGVFVDLENTAGLEAAARHGRAAGMGGMMCIHPKQVDVINRAFSPKCEEIAWAKAILEASSGEKGSFSFRGQMIDHPVLERARSILEDGT